MVVIPQVDTMDIIAECECRKKDKLLKMWERSGINLENRYMTFESFKPFNQITKYMKSKAAEYVMSFKEIKNSRHNSIAFLGQVGAGKTHLTIAISDKFINNGITVYYFQYVDMITKLKQNITDAEYYQKLTQKYKEVEVLLIDDLFKSKENKITDSDIRIMFDIINYRYVNNLPIIVSSEKTADDLLQIDEGLGSRIIQMSKNFLITVEGKENNFRLKGVI